MAAQPAKKKPKKAPSIPPSSRVWKHGAPAAGWLPVPGPVLADGMRNHAGGGILGAESSDELLGDGTRNHAGGRLFGQNVAPPSSSRLAHDQPRTHDGGHLFGLGYVPDEPDHRDLKLHDLAQVSPAHAAILNACSQPTERGHVAHELCEAVDLSAGMAFGPVQAQGPVQSCTAQAVAAMVEFHYQKQMGRHQPLSRLFLYKVARELLGIEGDRGCTIRETIKAIRRYGCLLEERWPYEPAWLECLPRIAHLEEARRTRHLIYCRLDNYKATGEQTLENVLHTLMAGFPVAFGFPVYECIDAAGKDHILPLPGPQSRRLGGHAVLAVGYRLHSAPGKLPRAGEILFRNSWGAKWGQKGYGYLPFTYVTEQLALDFWTMHCEH